MYTSPEALTNRKWVCKLELRAEKVVLTDPVWQVKLEARANADHHLQKTDSRWQIATNTLGTCAQPISRQYGILNDGTPCKISPSTIRTILKASR